ncbi:hypothetical protein RvY_05454 [Ramazzottius varieornatus]|uniref:LEM domain-containing protein n=1 Tax=Ramazzottius varieornatus TaxID=947166 RepID=A0A1D1V4W6_RAMVA|nr:hypothetical protein RvY_05454 [Ramazzottius varieornatus]
MADQEIAALTDNQLRDRLRSHGVNVPPITESTRKTLQNRLLKLDGKPVISTPSASEKKTTVVTTTETVTSRQPSPTRRGLPAGFVGPPLPGATQTIKRTPSPQLNSLPRPVKPVSATRRPATRSTAAFSSDEDDDVVELGRVGGLQRSSGSSTSADATAGTPLVGFLNGRSLWGARNQRPRIVASTDSPSSGNGFSRFFARQQPKTSTPTEKRPHSSLHDSFGAMTPIRDDGRRSTLGRPSLASLVRQSDETDLPAAKKRPGFFSRLLADPIHLTPQPSSREETDRHYTRHEPPRPRPLVFNSSGSTSRTEEEEGWSSWFGRNISRLLLALFLMFLVGVLAYYARMKWDSSDIDSSIMHFRLGRPALADKLLQCEDGKVVGDGTCNSFEDVTIAMDMVAHLAKKLASMKGDASCEGHGPTSMSYRAAQDYAVENVHLSDAGDFGRAVNLIIANPHWGIDALTETRRNASTVKDVRFLESRFATKSFLCNLKEAVKTTLFRISLLGLGIGALSAAGAWFYYFLQRRSKRQEQVYQMVNSIIGHVRNQHEQNGKAVPLSHIREMLVPHGPDRKRLLPVWDEAVAYIQAHESRIGSQFQQINGEDFEVWNWTSGAAAAQPDRVEPDSSVSSAPVVASSNNMASKVIPRRNRSWGVNTRPANSGEVQAATSCLKVRGMFVGSKESQSDLSWVDDIQDAILEKCRGVARILDIQVETTSDEGIAYIKLATSEDARNAYLALQGNEFDNNMVTVKFLKLERYHQRFPGTELKMTQMQPSKRVR